MAESIIKTRVTPSFRLEIDPEDGSPIKVWRLCPTYKAIAKIEEKIGKDIKKWDSWPLSSKDFPVVVWGMLDKFNPEVSVEEVIEVLNPEAQLQLANVITDLMFPGLREAFEKAQREKDTGETADPNAPKATPSV